MKSLAILIALFASSALAYTEDPHQTFNLANNTTNQIAVTIVPAKNVQAACEAESRRRGYGGFKISIEACSFWDSSKTNNRCMIIVPVWANYHTIGHEMRHCMQGDYHK